jgi:hypothetical protein
MAGGGRLRFGPQQADELVSAESDARTAQYRNQCEALALRGASGRRTTVDLERESAE